MGSTLDLPGETLTPFTPDDLTAAASALAVPGDFDIGKLRRLILGELQRRLEDPEACKDIPGTGLIQLAKELAKHAESQPEIDPSDGVDVLDLIQTEGLLPDRKLALLKAERAVTADRLERIDTALEEIQND